MPIKDKNFGASLVLIGDFAPLTFVPEFFKNRKFIRDADFDDLKVNMILEDLVTYRFSWLEVSAHRNRVAFNCPHDADIRVFDLFMNTFSLFQDLPANQLGINFTYVGHFTDAAEWHAFGDKLAPKEPWATLVMKGQERRGGLLSLAMEVLHEDDHPGYQRFKIEPRDRDNFGIFAELNSHFELRTAGERLPTERPPTAARAVSLVEKRWADTEVRFKTHLAGLLAGHERVAP